MGMKSALQKARTNCFFSQITTPINTISLIIPKPSLNEPTLKHQFASVSISLSPNPLHSTSPHIPSPYHLCDLDYSFDHAVSITFNRNFFSPFQPPLLSLLTSLLFNSIWLIIFHILVQAQYMIYQPIFKASFICLHLFSYQHQHLGSKNSQ
jgi:hypothetical protein